MHVSTRFTLVAVFATALPAVAQNTFVVPSKAMTQAPGSPNQNGPWDAAPQSFPFWGTSGSSNQARVQYLYDVTDIPISAGNLLAVFVRQPVGYSQQAATYQTTILVSVGPNASSSANPTFVANHAASPVTVFTGSLSLPATSNTPWPAQWQTPIPFTTPVPYSSALGQSLVIEFQTTSSSNNRSWTLEGYRAKFGNSSTELYQNSCMNSAGNRSGGWGWNPGGLVPGGSFTVNLSSYPINTPSLAANGLFFGVSGQGSAVGGLFTPFALTSIGLPSPAGCQWAIDISGGSYPMDYVQTTGTNPSAYLRIQNVPIPNNPALAGISFYTQDLALDMIGGTTPSLFPSIALQWYIGSGAGIPATRVYGTGSSLPSSGSVNQSEAAALQFAY